MKNSTLKIFSLFMLFGTNVLLVNSQITFTNSNASLHSDAGLSGSNANNRSGNSVCVVDVNGDGLDDIAKLDNNRYLRIEYQQAGGTFNYVFVGDCVHSGPWGMSMADVDHNGYKDLLFLDGSQAYLYKLNATGTGFLAGSPIALPNGAIFCQNGNFMDVNNDGWEDIFACNDVNESRIWVNDGAGNFPAEAADGVINFNVHPGTTAPNDESGNYSSVWTDFDNDGDVDFFVAHCRQGQPNGDVRRDDILFRNDGGGVWTEAGAAYNLNSNDQDWVGSYGDLDNDGDFDLLLIKHNVISRYYINDGAGHMTISPNTIAFGNMPMQSQFEDFDNDGFVDMIITGDNDHRLYHNNGNSTFTDVTPAGWTVGGNNILSFGLGDLNHDGKIDFYASYGSTYNSPSGTTDDVYWRNTTSNSNHYITFNLTGTNSTHGALGARIFIYGAWGVQTREVRASESYGNMSTFALHFGLGTATTVDSARIEWPSGTSDLLVNQSVDQFVSVVEGSTCSISGVTISYTGATTFCSPDSIQLNAPVVGGYTYLWSTGETTPSIYANSTNNYSVTCSTSPTCSATSPSVAITVDPVESVTISASGSTTFCPGGSVDLTSSSASANTWSTAETTQTITASAAGSYSVNYQGLCQSWPSNVITVTLLNNSAPTTTDDYIASPGTGTLTATGVGTDIDWYDAAVGGTWLYNGTTFITPSVSANTTYYAEEVHSYGGGTATVGSTNIAGSTYTGTGTNGFLKFDVLANCTLTSVDVSTDSAGARIIELRDNLGAVISSYPVTLAVGTTTVPVNFTLTPGSNYQLGTNTAQNNTSFGYSSPRLVRETGTTTYPYTSSAVNITTGNNGGADNSSYYYFFNWQIDVTPTDVCTSVRTPATVFMTAGVAPISEFNIMVYPNPTSDFVNVQFTTPENGEAMLSIFDMLGKKVYDLNLGVVNGSVLRTISTATYAKGVYNVKLTINGKDYNTRVIVK